MSALYPAPISIPSPTIPIPPFSPTSQTQIPKYQLRPLPHTRPRQPHTISPTSQALRPPAHRLPTYHALPLTMSIVPWSPKLPSPTQVHSCEPWVCWHRVGRQPYRDCRPKG
ncbi:hypothetical protein EJ05DRAFT_250502 [Pseudovirgaria hyperparasitica]|uniref:Uncharacterized protein n=1 Tax=Pseudovirgaria hyperparasitica TaxID=470096 RepID=A0A6A6WDX1_9PEZI|nr:uncharacterized protein EJ05DRAFT_250502 [Pseudovirgaria hyperparasitica]KAF2761022.1 hypothetical protein EJ05DRAFT_250502 [Pseudovirgaria hyperparasitica]